jgi:hypothetical protein
MNDPLPVLSHAKVAEYGLDTPAVVGMGVGDDQIVDRSYPTPPEKGGNHAFPDVIISLTRPPSVDQHDAAVRELHQDRISVTHIYKSDLELREVGCWKADDEKAGANQESYASDHSLRLEPPRQEEGI